MAELSGETQAVLRSWPLQSLDLGFMNEAAHYLNS